MTVKFLSKRITLRRRRRGGGIKFGVLLVLREELFLVYDAILFSSGTLLSLSRSSPTVSASTSYKPSASIFSSTHGHPSPLVSNSSSVLLVEAHASMGWTYEDVRYYRNGSHSSASRIILDPSPKAPIPP